LSGCNSGASQEEIKEAYRQKAIELHPDKNEGQESEEFLAVNHAYRILSREDLRNRYDTTGDAQEIDPEEQEAISQVIMHFEMALESMRMGEDLVKKIKSLIQASINNTKMQVQGLKDQVFIRSQLRKKLKRKKMEGMDLLGNLLETQIFHMEDAIEKTEKVIEIMRRSLAMMDDYQFGEEDLLKLTGGADPFMAMDWER
jgi:hypothetical protein